MSAPRATTVPAARRVRRMNAHGWAVMLSVAALGCASGARSIVRCTPGGCGEGQSCLVGSCRPANAEVVAAPTRRVVLPATELVALCSATTASTPGAVMAFRGPTCRRPTLLLRFAAPWGPDARVVAAYLVLVPAPDALPIGANTALEVAPVLEPWSPSTVAWRPPSTGRAAGRLLVSPGHSAGAALRVEVTALVSAWAQRTVDDNGVAITVESASEPTLALATRAGAESAAPALDVYLR